MRILIPLLLIVCFCGPAVAQDLPPDILADQYLLQVRSALAEGDTQTALEAFRQIEALDTVPPPEFAFFYGRFLVENGTALDDLLKGRSFLTSYVISIPRESERYVPSLELLSLAAEKLEAAEADRARREMVNPEIATIVRQAPTTADQDTLLTYAVSREYSLDVVAELIARGAPINAADRWGYTPLHKVRWSDQMVGVVSLLLDHGADIRALDSRGQSPLVRLAERARSFEDGGRARDALVRVAELLLRHGAHVDGESERANTPLTWAANYGHYEMVELLIRAGANVNVQGGTDRPLDLAIRNNHRRVVRLLRAHGASAAWAADRWPDR